MTVISSKSRQDVSDDKPRVLLKMWSDGTLTKSVLDSSGYTETLKQIRIHDDIETYGISNRVFSKEILNFVIQDSINSIPTGAFTIFSKEMSEDTMAMLLEQAVENYLARQIIVAKNNYQKFHDSRQTSQKKRK